MLRPSSSRRPALRALLGMLAAVLVLAGLQGTAQAATARTLTVKASTTGVLAKGGVTFSGVLSKSPKGSAVTVQRKSGATWVAAKTTKTKTAAGAWSVRVAVPSKVGTYSFRAVAPKTGALKAATSAVVKVSALRKAAVPTFKVSPAYPKTVKAGQNATFSGSVKPFVKGSTVVVQRLDGRTWRTLTTTTVTAKGTFSKATPVLNSGIVRAYVPRAGLNAPATSLSSSVIVDPVIGTTALPNATKGSSYSFTLTNLGKVKGEWTATNLPAGLGVAKTSGVISGVPTTDGTKNVTIGFKDPMTGQVAASKTLPLTVGVPQPPVVTTASLPDATVGVPYSQQLAATNGPGTWTATSPLPGGLSLSAGGVLSGTPDPVGGSPVVRQVDVTFTNGTSGLSGSKSLALTIKPPPPPPTITTASLPPGVVGEAYATTLTASAGPGTWSAGPLPAGLSLNPGTGAITGTPTTAATTAVTLGYTQTGNPTPATPVVLNLQVKNPAPVILTSTLPDAKIGASYSATLAVSGGVAGTWSVDGLAGTGLSVNASTGVISGTAFSLLPVTKTLTVDFTETGGSAAAPKTLSLRIANSNPAPATEVGAGGQYSCRIKSDQTLACWGYDDSGELGDGGVLASDPIGVLNPVQVGSAADWSGLSVGRGLVTERHACALRGTAAYCWGSDKYGELGSATAAGSATAPVLVDGGLAWAGVAAGSTSTCGVTTTGALYCWGDNTFGQLGTGGGSTGTPVRVGTASSWTGVSVGYTSACATRGDATLWCWGLGDRGQLGNGGTSSATPVQVSGVQDWTSVSVGSGAACGLRATGVIACWGIAADGRLGNGVTTNTEVKVPTQVGTDTSWTSISIGDATTCATRSNGTLYCWGRNLNGQVGNGTTSASGQGTPVQVGTATDWAAVSTGSTHSCAAKDTGAISCWGNNGKGQLGNGGTTEAHAPVAVVG